MSIIRHRWVWYALSVVLVGGSIAIALVFGLKFGIDFTGGSLLAARFEVRPQPVQVEQALQSLDLGEITIQPVGEKDMNFRLKSVDEPTHQKILETLNAQYGTTTELQYTSVGPSVGAELRSKSVWALATIFIAILAYIGWSFRKVSAPVQSWKYGVITIITAFHDVAIPVGLFALLGRLANVEVNTPFIAAILTIMGYSINDTIVVLDRVRENLQTSGGTFEDIVDRSVKQTMLRSFNTSMTTILAMTAVFLFGGESIKHFALALIAGIATGTYSSIFIASPLLVSWSAWDAKRKAKA